MKFQILGLRSTIAVNKEVDIFGKKFINNLGEKTGIEMEWIDTPEKLSAEAIPLIFIQTGGTENHFLKVLNKLPRPITLLTSGVMNSLAASLEILAYIKSHSIKGKLIHGDLDDIASQLINLQKIQSARRQLSGARLGLIGAPSDWLIASNIDRDAAHKKLGIEIVDIPLEELIQRSKKNYSFDDPMVEDLKKHTFPSDELKKALNIYGAMKSLVDEYQLSGLSVRCFDLLEPLNNTGCIALALLNSQGIPSSCEGDVPALITMMILQLLVGEPGFQINPSRIIVNQNRMVVAHCTLPLSMTKQYSLKTHYESRIGVAVDGQLPLQKALMFKVNADLQRYFLSEIDILDNLSEKNLCRTQLEISISDEAIQYFLNDPCANHHVITLQNQLNLVKGFMESLD